MSSIIQAQLGEFRPIFYYRLPSEIDCKRGDCVVIKVDRGVEFGRVVTNIQAKDKPKDENPSGEIIRIANEDDHAQMKKNKEKAREAVNACSKRILEKKMDMQIVEAEYTFDTRKVIFFFTSEDRVDFRALVKDLARVFKVRIELKQIGVRDKAKITGGSGVCGRVLCCSSYLKSFHPLSIKMAKEQNLPLNDSKIAGSCGRIKCCMAYEYIAYKECARNLPRFGEKVTIPEGKGRVIDVCILKRQISVDLGDGKIKKVVYGKTGPEKQQV